MTVFRLTHQGQSINLFDMKNSKKPLLVLFASSLVFGALDPVFPHGKNEPTPLCFVLAIIYAICLFSWCKRDAAERNVKSGASAALVGLCAPLGIPYYFFRTRPFLQALFATLKALGVFILLELTYGIAAVICTWLRTGHV
jgi:hypothetical protein